MTRPEPERAGTQGKTPPLVPLPSGAVLNLKGPFSPDRLDTPPSPNTDTHASSPGGVSDLSELPSDLLAQV